MKESFAIRLYCIFMMSASKVVRHKKRYNLLKIHVFM